MGGAKLNCRGTMSQGPLEAVFFGPQVASAAKCSGGSAGRLTHARQIHREICALLLGALSSLQMALKEFYTVLPHQWAAILGASPTEASDTTQRLKKLSDLAKVRFNVYNS